MVVSAAQHLPTPAARSRFILGLQAQLQGALLRVLRPGTRCALIDVALHSNVGDSAILLGQLAFLRKYRMPLVYVSNFRGFSQDVLARRIGKGTILFSGGGSLGDVWPEHWAIRKQVLEAFPHNPIVQLPESIHFRSPEALDRAGQTMRGHPNYTLFVRDQRSLGISRNDLGVNRTFLCPDMAFALGELSRSGAPDCQVLILSRIDREKRNGYDFREVRGVMEVADWLKECPPRLMRVNRALTHRINTNPELSSVLSRPVQWTYGPIARARLRRGCRLLSRGQVVITDRLHGHIMSVLMGIPHVVLDNSYGKIRSFYDTWTSRCGFALWADSQAQAIAVAEQLANRLPPSNSSASFLKRPRS